jgi:peptide deformylase
MAKLTILEYPDPRLRTRAEPVARVDDALRRLIDDMFETMYAAPGIGLAATQVNVHKRLLVIDVSEDKNHPLVFVNPEIVERQGSVQAEEGCLSVPKIFETLAERSERVVVRALGRDGKPFELEAGGLLAICIQHEIDHLDGKLFVDYLSELKRTRIRKKLEKDRRDRAESPAGAEGSRAPVI